MKTSFWIAHGNALGLVGDDLGAAASTATGTGRDISITDGHWIITMGQFGIVGFIAEFGLLGFSVLRAAGSLKFARMQ